MERNFEYPAHIYDPIRIEIASEFLGHELGNFLPSTNDLILSRDTEKWFDESPNFFPVRDFWNIFWSISMGTRLKPNFYRLLTAANVKWSFQEIDIDEIYFGISWPPKTPIPQSGFTSVKDVKEFYKQNPNKIYIYEPRDPDYKIVLCQHKKADVVQMVVEDGSNHLNQYILKNKQKIEAWVGTYSDDSFTPKNYWVPTALIYELVLTANREWIKNKSKFLEVTKTIKELIKDSESGKYEFANRCLHGQKEFIEEIKKEVM